MEFDFDIVKEVCEELNIKVYKRKSECQKKVKFTEALNGIIVTGYDSNELDSDCHQSI